MKSKLAILFFLICIYTGAQQTFFFRQFTVEDGLPTNTIYDIDEDENGNMIFGTDNGLSFFNGTVFKTLGTKDGLANPYVVSIHKEKKGKLYFSCYGSDLMYIENGKVKSTNFREFNQYEIVSDERNVYLKSFLLWTAGKIENGKTTPVLYNGKYKRIPNVSLLNSISKKDWSFKFERFTDYKFLPIYSQEKNIIRTVGNTLVFKNKKVTINEPLPKVLQVFLRKNDVALVTQEKILFYNFRGGKISETLIPISNGNNLANRRFLIMDRDENFWFSEQQNGIYKFENNDWTDITERIRFNKNQNINQIFCDRNNGIWLATNENGVIYIPNISVKQFQPKDGDLFFTSFFELNRELYTATRFRLFKIDKKGIIEQKRKGKAEIRLGYFNEKPIVYSFDAINVAFKKNYFKNVSVIYGNSGFKTKDLYVTTSKNFFTFYNNDLKRITESNYNQQKNRRIQSIIPYKNHFLHNNGEELLQVDFIKEQNFVNYKILRKLPLRVPGFIVSIAQKSADTLLIANENTLYTAVKEKITDSLKGINNRNFSNLNNIFLKNNEVWLASQDGLFKISKKRNIILNKFNFLINNDVSSIEIVNNNLFVATKNGLTEIPLAVVNQHVTVPKFKVNRYFTTKDFHLTSNHILLSSNDNFLRLFLDIQNFNDVKNQIIRYKLNDSEWNYIDAKEIDFPSLAFGNHELTVQIKDVNSSWSSEKLKIEKKYPFYLRWWFWLLLLLTFSFIIWYYYRNQLRTKEAEHQKETDFNNRIIELRQSAMSAMMNPHFIFNALNAIQYFVNSNQKEKSSEFLGKLSRLVRLFLHHASEPYISLEEEIKRLSLYVELEQVRFNNSFEFLLKIDPSINPSEIKIPNMILQPFLENAIIHGVAHLPDHDGIVELSFQKRDKKIYITIKDNGFGVNPDKKRQGHTSKGIAIIKERIKMLSEKDPEKEYSFSTNSLHQNSDRKGHLVEISFCI